MSSVDVEANRLASRDQMLPVRGRRWLKLTLSGKEKEVVGGRGGAGERAGDVP
jgi:hypothetical protein